MNTKFLIQIADASGKLSTYFCTHCKTAWNKDEVPPEMQKAEGCPDCMKLCERCGMPVGLGDRKYELEHCL